MPAIDIVDSTWIGARAAMVGAVVAEPANWQRWWPDLQLRVIEHRAEKGVQWHVDSVARTDGCRLAGSAEVWLQPQLDGVIAHFLLWLDGVDGAPVPARLVDQTTRRYRFATKRAFWALADQLDPGRLSRLTSAWHTSLG